MNYTRVIPRDLFNEAKLLKCIGQLALKVADGLVPNDIDIYIEENGEPFDIILYDYSLCIINYMVKVNDKEVTMKTTYNSKSNYPLYCELDDEDTIVFDEQGEFTEEFINRFSNG